MSLGGGGGGQMQEVQKQIEALEQEEEALRAEIEGLRDEQAEIDEAIEALGAIETGSEVQVPLGGDAYVRAEVENLDEVIVSLGGGYAAELEEDDAVSALETKQDTLDDRIDDIQDEITEVETERAELEEKAQQLQQQQLQQLQQQQGGGGPDLGGDE